MGKTIPSYRMAVEGEIMRWKKFKDGLGSEDEKRVFDELMDLVRSNASAGSNACNPILFESMTMSILLGQQKRIRSLQRKIDALLVNSLSKA
jgi:hypothetical protein